MRAGNFWIALLAAVWLGLSPSMGEAQPRPPEEVSEEDLAKAKELFYLAPEESPVVHGGDEFGVVQTDKITEQRS